MTSYTQPPVPKPIDVAEIHLDEGSGVPTYVVSVPFNENAARHDHWQLQDRDIQKDLELIGLRKSDPQRARSPSPPLLSILPDLPEPILPPVEKEVPLIAPPPISSRRSPLPAIAPRPEGHVPAPSVLKPVPLEMPRQAPTARSVPNSRLDRSPKPMASPVSREAHDQLALRQRQMSGSSLQNQYQQHGDSTLGISRAQPIVLEEESASVAQQKRPLQPARHIYNRDNYPGEARNIYQSSQQQPPASHAFSPEMYKQASDQGNPASRDGKTRRQPVEKAQQREVYYQDQAMRQYPSSVQQPPYDPRQHPDHYNYPQPDYRGYRGEPIYQNAPPSAHAHQGYPPRRTSYEEQYAYDRSALPPPPPGLPGYPIYSPPTHSGPAYPRVPVDPRQGYAYGFSQHPPSYAYPQSHPHDGMGDLPPPPTPIYAAPPPRAAQYPEGDPRNHPAPPPLPTYDRYASYYAPPPPPPDAYRRA